MFGGRVENSFEIVDIHCHILPYVDDGAYDVSESIEILDLMRAQGVRGVCATPHLRARMFNSTDSDIISQYKSLREETRKRGMTFALSREYFFDERFRKLLSDGDVITYGRSRFVLTEFSPRNTMEEILSGVKYVVRCGYEPLIAHVERYPDLSEYEGAYDDLLDAGAFFQVNTSSVLGREGNAQRQRASELIKNQMVTVIASDTHNTDSRPPEWDQAIKALKRITDDQTIKEMCSVDPHRILKGEF